VSARSELGATGERLAVAHLEAKGYRVLARNRRLPPWGEIDIVAERDGLLVFVEVRTRRGGTFGDALASLTAAKRGRMVRAALRYAALHGDDAPPGRIDVIGISLDGQGRLLAVEHIENAVEG
jgi:putative endonuclease